MCTKDTVVVSTVKKRILTKNLKKVILWVVLSKCIHSAINAQKSTLTTGVFWSVLVCVMALDCLQRQCSSTLADMAKSLTVSSWTRSSATAEKQRVSCPHGGGRPSNPLPSAPSGYSYAYGRIQKPQRTYVKRAVRKAHFKMNRAFKVIQGHPYWCRQNPEWSVVVMCN